MLVHLIADYGPGDLAFAEAFQRLKGFLPDAEPVFTPVAPFATLAAGFCIAQLGLNGAPPGTLIYHNVAPREDDPEAREGNAGERLAYARLPTGVRVVGVNAGYAYSFLREAAEELRWTTADAAGSQFRSRDLFPEVAAATLLGQREALAERIDPRDIPPVPTARLAYTDGYGNLKTTLHQNSLPYGSGSRLRVSIGEVALSAVVSDGSFAVKPGELALAPGSSGWRTKTGELRWLELFLRGGNAWESFGRPPVGAHVTLEPA